MLVSISPLAHYGVAPTYEFFHRLAEFVDFVHKSLDVQHAARSTRDCTSTQAARRLAVPASNGLESVRLGGAEALKRSSASSEHNDTSVHIFLPDEVGKYDLSGSQRAPV